MSGFQNVTHIGDYQRKTVNGDGVTTWQQAHRIAMMAAAQAHHDLGIVTNEPPIDVATAIIAADVLLMWHPLPRLFGMYLNEPGQRPGIQVNAALPHGARRHTAAHELGHHRLGHSTGTDDGDTIETTINEDEMPARRRVWPDHEKVAEAFAAWFLMPRLAVAAALGRLGLSRPGSPMDIYQLSLLLGTSYRTTARHLPNLNLIPQSLAAQCMRTPPGRLKSQLDAGAEPPDSRSSDVWLLDTGMTGATLEIHGGDRLVIDVPPGQDLHHPPWLTPVPRRVRAVSGDARRVLRCSPEESASSPDDSSSSVVEGGAISVTAAGQEPVDGRAIRLNRVVAPRGIDLRCLPSVQASSIRQENNQR